MVGTSNLGSWNGHWIYECSNHSNQCLTVVHLTWWPGLSIDDVLMPMETLPRPPGSPHTQTTRGWKHWRITQWFWLSFQELGFKFRFWGFRFCWVALGFVVLESTVNTTQSLRRDLSMSRKNPSGDVKVAIENGPVEIVFFYLVQMVIFHSKLLVDQRVNLVGQEMDRIFGRDATPLLFGRECLARRHSESSYKPQLFLVNSHMLSTCVMLGMIQRCCCCCSWRCWSCGCGCSCLLTHVCYTSQYVAGLMLRSLCLLDKSLWLLVLARNMFGYLLFNPLVVGISPRFLSELSFWLLGTSNLSAQTSWFLANSFPTFRWLDPHVCSFINPCFGCWSSPVGEISPSLVFFFAYFLLQTDSISILPVLPTKISLLLPSISRCSLEQSHLSLSSFHLAVSNIPPFQWNLRIVHFCVCHIITGYSRVPLSLPYFRIPCLLWLKAVSWGHTYITFHLWVAFMFH